MLNILVFHYRKLPLGLSLLGLCAIGMVGNSSAKNNQMNPMVITEMGVGSIGAQTKATQAKLKTLFPDYRIAHEKSYSEGMETGENFKIFDGDQLLLEVTTDSVGSDKLFGVTVHDPKIKTPVGLHVNSNVDELLNQESNPYCYEGSEESQGEVICKLRNPQNVFCAFTDSSDDQFVPSNRTMKVTKASGRKIIAIWWKSPQKS